MINKTDGQPRMCISKASGVAALVMILFFGLVYRAAAYRIEKVVQTPIKLPVPLQSVPVTINGWNGKDMPLSETVIKAAANDDYVNRLYVNSDNHMWATLYVAYSARPRTMLGHRPDVCYVSAGWVRDSTEQSFFISRNGKKIPCLIHRFHKPDASRDELVVLNFYIVNGMASNDENLFSGVQWRTPNINGNIAHYVAQVQVSSVLEDTVVDGARDMFDSIMNFFPDEQGKVGAAMGTYGALNQ